MSRNSYLFTFTRPIPFPSIFNESSRETRPGQRNETTPLAREA